MEDPMPFLSNSKSGLTIDTPPTSIPKRIYNPMELIEK